MYEKGLLRGKALLLYFILSQWQPRLKDLQQKLVIYDVARSLTHLWLWLSRNTIPPHNHKNCTEIWLLCWQLICFNKKQTPITSICYMHSSFALPCNSFALHRVRFWWQSTLQKTLCEQSLVEFEMSLSANHPHILISFYMNCQYAFFVLKIMILLCFWDDALFT